MIKVHTKRFARSWLYVAAAGLVVAYLGYHTYETQLGAQAPAGQQADAFGSLFHREASTGSANKVVNEAASASVLGAHSAHDEEQASTAHDTGMEDWKNQRTPTCTLSCSGGTTTAKKAPWHNAEPMPAR